jgi:hypothetical protein
MKVFIAGATGALGVPQDAHAAARRSAECYIDHLRD